jgi:hypothetical protein
MELFERDKKARLFDLARNFAAEPVPTSADCAPACLAANENARR